MQKKDSQFNTSSY